MKNKIVLNVSCEDVFNYISAEFIDDYEKRKKKTLNREEIMPGLTFSKAIGRDKKTKVINMASVKLLKYNYPYEYGFEYRSKTFYRVTMASIKPINDNKCELTSMSYQEKLKNNGKPSEHSFDDEEIEKLTLMQRFQYKSMERQIKKGRKNAIINNKKDKNS